MHKRDTWAMAATALKVWRTLQSYLVMVQLFRCCIANSCKFEIAASLNNLLQSVACITSFKAQQNQSLGI